MDPGQSWIVDAYGCRPDALRSSVILDGLFNLIIRELSLRPVGPATWHTFPTPGGVTGFLLLSESHLSIHTFPEIGFAAIDLYCCRALPEWNWSAKLREHLGAERVTVGRQARGATAK